MIMSALVKIKSRDIMDYKYEFTDKEKLALEIWSDITELVRKVEWNLYLSDEEKQIGRKALSIFLCETDNFNEVFLKTGYNSEDYLEQVLRGVLKAKETLINDKEVKSELFRKLEELEQKVSTKYAGEIYHDLGGIL